MTDPHVLVIRRVLDAPRHLVFAAWVDPVQAARWWGPRGFTTVSNRMDVRVGGEWRRRMRSPEGTEHVSRGIYREIAPPERLVFTFAWEQGGAPGHGPETAVTLTLADLGDGRTELTLRQEGFATASARDGHYRGWTSCLQRFADYLGAINRG
ncbi:MAG TPA: SRPBCC domain-containing protein [Stellaceae bacterium]|nr:SRPBCC domain-containing protein [Stellaceae bacterium]